MDLGFARLMFTAAFRCSCKQCPQTRIRMDRLSPHPVCVCISRRAAKRHLSLCLLPPIPCAFLPFAHTRTHPDTQPRRARFFMLPRFPREARLYINPVLTLVCHVCFRFSYKFKTKTKHKQNAYLLLPIFVFVLPFCLNEQGTTFDSSSAHDG